MRYVYALALGASLVGASCRDAMMSSDALVGPSVMAMVPQQAQASGSSAIALNEDPTTLSHGDSVSFTYVIDPKVAEKHLVGLIVRCTQNGALVYVAGGWPIQQPYILSSRAWNSGAADCSATLETMDTPIRVLVATTFHVSA